MTDDPQPPSGAEVKARLRRAYDEVSEAAVATGARGFRWLHAGVAPAGPTDVVIDTPLRWGPINAAHARLTAELIGPVDLNGASLLESGSGRGGNLMACNRWFDLRRCVGLDLSGVAVAATVAALGDRGVAGVHGDAERLPFGTDTFDAVLCIESAGHYPDRLGFFGEVARIVRPGGWFLYAESLDPAGLGAVSRSLKAAGFDQQFGADVGERVRRYWIDVSGSAASARAVEGMTDDEAASVGPGTDSDLGRLLSDGTNGYHLMRWQRVERADDLDGVTDDDRVLVNPGGDHAAGIIESYGQGTWVRAVNQS